MSQLKGSENDNIPIPDYFKHLDHEIVNIESIEDTCLTIQGHDVLVQDVWELPVVLMWPESEVFISFSTQYGDIDFEAFFIPAPEDNEV